MKLHSIASIWPVIAEDQLSDLVESVRINGLLVPILTWKGEVVDGRHRLIACERAGIAVRAEALPDNWTLAQVIAHVTALNSERRHLTQAQKAMVAVRCVALVSSAESGAKDRKAHSKLGSPTQCPGLGGNGKRERPRALTVPGLGGNGKASDDIAKASGVSSRSIERARVVDAVDGLGDRVLNCELSLKQAEKIARAPEKERNALADQLVSGDDWGTPPEIIALVRTAMGSIDCDPATNSEAQARIKATTYYTEETEGLGQKWLGNVWLNPPYSQPLIGHFAEKLLAELDSGNATQACMLINTITDTRSGQELLMNCSAVLFLNRRVRFIAPGSETPLPGTRYGQMLLYFGPNVVEFVRAFAGHGWIGRGCDECDPVS